MEHLKWVLKKYGFILGVLLLVILIGSNIYKNKNKIIKNQFSEASTEVPTEASVWEKGYDLPVDPTEGKEAETECLEVAASVQKLLKEEGINITEKNAEDKIERTIIDVVAEKGYPIYETGIYRELYNYEKMETFLKRAAASQKGEIVLYELHSESGYAREKYYFDGKDMYYLNTSIVWSEDGEPCITPTAYCRIKEWSYTEKGWFCYEMCVPEPPEVTEIVIGNKMIRVRPLDEKYKEVAEKYLRPIGYQGNNLFCSEWDKNNMEDIDYNGLFEYFYAMRYEKPFAEEQHSSGISENEFIEMMKNYLPVTTEQLGQYGVYDQEQKVFAWESIGCMNYAPNAFGTSVPEITDMTTNEDGTVNIRIDAVCEMAGTDKIFSHELTVRFTDEGGIKYLGNHILESGLENVPAYQYRFQREQ